MQALPPQTSPQPPSPAQEVGLRQECTAQSTRGQLEDRDPPPPTASKEDPEERHVQGQEKNMDAKIP